MTNPEMTPPKRRRNRVAGNPASFFSLPPYSVVSKYAVAMLVLAAMLLVGYALYVPYAWAVRRLTAALGPKFFPDSRLRAPSVMPGEYKETLKHFKGAELCDIQLRELYNDEGNAEPGIGGHKIFCETRLQFLDAITWGIPMGSEAFEGLGCTWRFFTTIEVCMILERFNAVVFVGDDLAKRMYMGLNILLREDLAFGALRDWELGPEERERCHCWGQFKGECVKSVIMSSEVKDGGRGGYFCKRPPHVYLPVTGSPPSSSSVESFKSLIFSRPNPWQPSPVVFSVTAHPLSDSASTIKILKEWRALASGAKRNVPMLVIGPEAVENTGRPEGLSDEEVQVETWMEQMRAVKTEMHFDLMGIYNLTLETHGMMLEERLAIVQAMIVVNWLARLQAS